jgi:transposase
MDVLHQRCCGVDVHKASVVACLLVAEPGRVPRKEVRTFGTMTEDLLALVDWLVGAGCTHVAMESTGSFWKPLYNLLEGVLAEVLVVNAAHIKQVPGRKTDVKDAEWIADLLRHGLLQASFIPDRPQRELRELTRYRTSLVRERSAEVNRLQKVLEGANIKLSVVAKDLTGVSSRAILAALLDGHLDAAAMAQLARGKLRAKIPQLEQALVGQFGAHQRFMITEQLIHIDDLDASLERISAQITERVGPFAQEIEQLDTITGVGQRTAEALVSEVGVEMRRFPTADHLTSWAGLAPGNNESAGKRRSGKTRKGSPWLRAVLIEAAHAAGRTKDTYLGAQYRRLLARRGKKRAAVAVARSILIIAYHILRDHEPYKELGGTYFDQRDRAAVERRLVRRLEELGYDVSLQPKQPAA